MGRPTMPLRVPQRFEVGQKVAFSRTFTEADMSLFIGITWDINPYHTDEQFAAQTKFQRRILPGLLTASMATHFGGLWGFLAQEMRFEFVGPVYVNDTITATCEVIEVEPRGKVRCRVSYSNQAGQEVLRGEFAGFPTPISGPGDAVTR